MLLDNAQPASGRRGLDRPVGSSPRGEFCTPTPAPLLGTGSPPRLERLKQPKSTPPAGARRMNRQGAQLPETTASRRRNRQFSQRPPRNRAGPSASRPLPAPSPARLLHRSRRRSGIVRQRSRWTTRSPAGGGKGP